MRRRVSLSMIVLLAVGFVGACADEVDLQMGGAVELSRGGVSISLPSGCEPGPLAEPHQLLLAFEIDEGERVLGVTLSAFPVEPEVTAERFAGAMIDYLRGQLVVRDLAEVRSLSMDAADMAGVGRVVTYTLRGEEKAAASVCFIRPQAEDLLGLCYVLTVEAPASEVDTIEDVLNTVAQTVSLGDIMPTSLAEAGAPGEAVKVAQLDFSIRPPQEWFAVTGPAGVQMGQMDYAFGGGIVMPAAQLTVKPIAATEDAASCAAESLATVIEIGKESGLTVEILTEAPATMGGLAGYEFMVRQSTPPVVSEEDAADDADEETADDADQLDVATGAEEADDEAEDAMAVVVAQRVVCRVSADPQVGTRSYSLTLLCRGDEVASAQAIMDQLADGFELTDDDEIDQPAE